MQLIYSAARHTQRGAGLSHEVAKDSLSQTAALVLSRPRLLNAKDAAAAAWRCHTSDNIPCPQMCWQCRRSALAPSPAHPWQPLRGRWRLEAKPSQGAPRSCWTLLKGAGHALTGQDQTKHVFVCLPIVHALGLLMNVRRWHHLSAGHRAWQPAACSAAAAAAGRPAGASAAQPLAQAPPGGRPPHRAAYSHTAGGGHAPSCCAAAHE